MKAARRLKSLASFAFIGPPSDAPALRPKYLFADCSISWPFSQRRTHRAFVACAARFQEAGHREG